MTVSFVIQFLLFIIGGALLPEGSQALTSIYSNVLYYNKRFHISCHSWSKGEPESGATWSSSFIPLFSYYCKIIILVIFHSDPLWFKTTALIHSKLEEWSSNVMNYTIQSHIMNLTWLEVMYEGRTKKYLMRADLTSDWRCRHLRIWCHEAL